MLTDYERDLVDAAITTRNGAMFERHADIFRQLVAERRADVYALRVLEQGGVLVCQPGTAPAILFQRSDGAGLLEIHSVVRASPGWRQLEGSRHAVRKRLLRAIARIEPHAPALAERLAEGLHVRDGTARWQMPWRLGRGHVYTS